MKLVVQRTPNDCGIACLAMLTSRSYEDVIETVGDAFEPDRGLRQEQEALRRLGFRSAFENGVPVGDFVCHSRHYFFSPALLRFWIWGRRALVSTPSLNYDGGMHMVYFDGNDVLDPSPGKRYEKYVDLQPEEVVIFRERSR